MKIKEIDREKAYDEAKEIMKQDGLDDSKTSELFGKIQLIKLSSKGRVPEDIIDYLISEILNEKSALHINSKKYKEYIGRTLESFGINHISKEISDKQSKFYFFREYIDVADSLGTQAENTIYLSEDIIPKTIEAINTIFHENTHIEQDYRFKGKDNYSYYEYMALKENILCKEIPVFQMNNYKLLFLEINARQRANLKMLKYFLNSERLKKRVSESKIKEIIDDYKKDTISYGGAYNKKEKADDTEEKDINVLFRETLKKEVIKEYPILALEYNEDCSEKTPQEIMEEIEESKDASKTILLTKILENNEIFKKSNMYRDVSYFIDYSAKNKTMEKIYGHVLTGTVLREMYNRYKEFDNLSQEEKEEFCKIIKKAQNKIINEPDSTFSRRISKCGKSRSSPIKTFQLMQKYVEMKVPEISINEEENQK